MALAPVALRAQERGRPAAGQRLERSEAGFRSSGVSSASAIGAERRLAQRAVLGARRSGRSGSSRPPSSAEERVVDAAARAPPRAPAARAAGARFDTGKRRTSATQAIRAPRSSATSSPRCDSSGRRSRSPRSREAVRRERRERRGSAARRDTAPRRAAPVIGPCEIPLMPWPVATTRFSSARGRPRIGRSSGVSGRRPRQVSSRSPLDAGQEALDRAQDRARRGAGSPTDRGPRARACRAKRRVVAHRCHGDLSLGEQDAASRRSPRGQRTVTL